MTPRKPGRPPTPKKDHVVTFSGTMHPIHLAKMRALQKGQPLGKFLVRSLGLERSDQSPDAGATE